MEKTTNSDSVLVQVAQQQSNVKSDNNNVEQTNESKSLVEKSGRLIA
jgi:hypothetical protein